MAQQKKKPQTVGELGIYEDYKTMVRKERVQMGGLPHYYGDEDQPTPTSKFRFKGPIWPLVAGSIFIVMALILGGLILLTDIEDSEKTGTNVPVVSGDPRVIELKDMKKGEEIVVDFSTDTPVNMIFDTLENCELYEQSFLYAGVVAYVELDLEDSSGAKLTFEADEDGDYGVVFDNPSYLITHVDYTISYPPRYLVRLLIWGGVSMLFGVGLIGLYIFLVKRQARREKAAKPQSGPREIEHIIIEGQNDPIESDDSSDHSGRNPRDDDFDDEPPPKKRSRKNGKRKGKKR